MLVNFDWQNLLNHTLKVGGQKFHEASRYNYNIMIVHSIETTYFDWLFSYDGLFHPGIMGSSVWLDEITKLKK